ncbi:MAG: hypothetical protein ABIJ31_08765 [Pseudomonadota bacterium]
MVTTGLTILWFFGFVYLSNRWLKIELCYAPLFSISFVGTFLFVLSVSDMLKPGAHFLLAAGFLLFAIGSIEYLKNRHKIKAVQLPGLLWVVAGLMAVSFVLTIGMKLKVDDDYVYWGIMGRYLHFFDHLPDRNTTIISRHLAYTPGTSLVHYLIYQLAGQYSTALSYFAQNLFLISAVCVVFARKNLKKGAMLLFFLVILMTLFSGSVFTRLQVDHLLSVYFFAVLWIILKEQPGFRTLLTISLPCVFLFLIKEIGFIMGIVLLLVFFVDLLFYRKIDIKEKFRTVAGLFLCAGLLFAIKQVWTKHCVVMGFSQFNGAVNWESIQTALHIFSNDNIQKGFLLFVKECFIGPSDRLKLPYIVWYMVLLVLFMKIKGLQDKIFTKRFFRMGVVLITALLIYLVMLYFLQVIVFDVGRSNDHIIGFARYMNILFSPVVFLLVLLYAEQKLYHKIIPQKLVFSLLFVVLLLLGASRVETSLRREKFYDQARIIAQQIQTTIDINQSTRIGVIPGTGDNNLWIRLLYYLLPARINQGAFPADNAVVFLENIKQYDYVLFYHPDQMMIDRAHSFLNDGFKDQGFYKVEQTDKLEARQNKDGLDIPEPDTNMKLIKLF